jgi:hypothetical protein
MHAKSIQIHPSPSKSIHIHPNQPTSTQIHPIKPIQIHKIPAKSTEIHLNIRKSQMNPRTSAQNPPKSSNMYSEFITNNYFKSFIQPHLNSPNCIQIQISLHAPEPTVTPTESAQNFT